MPESSTALPAPASDQLLVRDVSDTARSVAFNRAVETERADALFRDPFARRLAGELGERIANSKSFGRGIGWPIVARTYLIDKMIRAQIAQGADTVINLAAGLDTRPYRMELPASLRWVEVDLPGIISYKEEILRGEKPACSLERVRLDLSDVSARRKLFGQLGSEARKALVVAEGLLIYLGSEEVALFAQDLAAVPSFGSWIIDLASPALMRMLVRRMPPNTKRLFKFAPQEGPAFFQKFGWSPIEAVSLMKTAGRIKRLPFFMVPLSWRAETHGAKPSRPWGGVCLFSRTN
ncbi:MAG: SAM-dependent methyltransferase [Candidatus Acidiferrales bacterium]